MMGRRHYEIGSEEYGHVLILQVLRLLLRSVPVLIPPPEAVPRAHFLKPTAGSPVHIIHKLRRHTRWSGNSEAASYQRRHGRHHWSDNVSGLYQGQRIRQ